MLHPNFGKNLIFLSDHGHYNTQAIASATICQIWLQDQASSVLNSALQQEGSKNQAGTSSFQELFWFFPLNEQNFSNSQDHSMPHNDMSLTSSILFFHIINHFCISYNFNISSKRLTVSCLQMSFLLCIIHSKNVKHVLYTERYGHREGKARLMARLPAIAVCFLQQHNSLLFKIIFVHMKLSSFHRKLVSFSFINGV